MTEVKHGLFLTTGEVEPSPGYKRILAVISDGSPQHGHEDVTVLTMETFSAITPYAIIQDWFERMKLEQPWEAQQ